MRLKVNIGLIFVCFLSFAARPQKQNNVWYFGTQAGVNFNSGAAVSVSGGQTNAYEGVSSVCDVNGNLLFYTDGVTAWTRNHTVMPNGSGLGGGASSTQTLIVPFPKNCSKYYIFQVEDHMSVSNKLSYSVVDMCLNNGLGDVVAGQKNIFLLSPCGEKLTAVRHQNNTDIWVITHKLSSADFAAFGVTPAGVLAPVMTTIGGTHASNHMIGPIKANHSGDKICVGNTFGALCELFDFNNATGTLSNYVNLQTSCPIPYGVYGIEFSPNDKLLYISTTSNVNHLYQINLTSGLSTVLLGTSMGGGYYFGALQSAPDGKIYQAQNTASALNVINSPNTAGTGANFVLGGLPLTAGSTCQMGLPNFTPFTTYAGYDEDFAWLGNDTNISTCASFSLNLAPASFCNSSFLWSTGSTAPAISVTAAGAYWVTVSNICGTDTDTIQVNSVGTMPSVSVQAIASSICTGDSLTLIAAGATNYTWTSPIPTAQQHNDTVYVAPDSSTTYYLGGSNICGSDSTAFLITVNPIPVVTVNSDTICLGQAASLTAQGALHYTWTNGTHPLTGQHVTASPTTTTSYTVTGVDVHGCSDTAVATVLVRSISASFTSSTNCTGSSFSILSPGYSGCSWDFGDGGTSQDTNATHVYPDPGDYQVSLVIYGNGCSGTTAQTIHVSLTPNEPPVIPNTFTPNSDQVNELYLVRVPGNCRKLQGTIYDRWGVKLFESDDIVNKGWDGKMQGNPVPDGVYYVIVADGKNSYRQFIQLFR